MPFASLSESFFVGAGLSVFAIGWKAGGLTGWKAGESRDWFTVPR